MSSGPIACKVISRECENFHLHETRPSYVDRSFHARMAELADALDSKSCSERSVGSTPTPGTISQAKRVRGGDRILNAKAEATPWQRACENSGPLHRDSFRTVSYLERLRRNRRRFDPC